MLTLEPRTGQSGPALSPLKITVSPDARKQMQKARQLRGRRFHYGVAISRMPFEIITTYRDTSNMRGKKTRVLMPLSSKFFLFFFLSSLP